MGGYTEVFFFANLQVTDSETKGQLRTAAACFTSSSGRVCCYAWLGLLNLYCILTRSTYKYVAMPLQRCRSSIIAPHGAAFTQNTPQIDSDLLPFLTHKQACNRTDRLGFAIPPKLLPRQYVI